MYFSSYRPSLVFTSAIDQSVYLLLCIRFRIWELNRNHLTSHHLTLHWQHFVSRFTSPSPMITIALITIISCHWQYCRVCFKVFHGFGGRLSVIDVGPTTVNQIMALCFKEISLGKRDLNGKNQFGEKTEFDELFKHFHRYVVWEDLDAAIRISNEQQSRDVAVELVLRIFKIIQNWPTNHASVSSYYGMVYKRLGCCYYYHHNVKLTKKQFSLMSFNCSQSF